jgi:hypothetical protein
MRSKARYLSPPFLKSNGRAPVGIWHAASFAAPGKFCGVAAQVLERVCLAAGQRARVCWAGAAAAAAGCGLLGSTGLLASALRTSVAMVGLFDIEVMKKDQVVLLLETERYRKKPTKTQKP